MTESVGVHEAKTHLSHLLTEVAEGTEVIISNRGEPVARLVPIRRDAGRILGSDRGRFSVPDDFDAPLPDEIVAAFET